MKLWAIGDLHLCISVPKKSMEFFGTPWIGYIKKIEENWKKYIQDEDIVLVPGDISWALKWEDALVDLKWIDCLPGKKIMIRGNHDYWWGSLTKMAKDLPSSIILLQNNSITIGDISIGGSRLWDTVEFTYAPYIEFQENPHGKNKEESIQKDLSEKIFERELIRLELSLNSMKKNATRKIIMTHYPPIGPYLQASRASNILESFGIEICVFGHLHHLRKNVSLFGEKNGVRYLLAASDYLDFIPLQL